MSFKLFSPCFFIVKYYTNAKYILVRVLRAVATIDTSPLSINKDNDFIDREIPDSLQFPINQTL